MSCEKQLHQIRFVISKEFDFLELVVSFVTTILICSIIFSLMEHYLRNKLLNNRNLIITSSASRWQDEGQADRVTAN
jgi:hypothetical protein